jgi:nucleotide-binding universal stress UspA family protein
MRHTDIVVGTDGSAAGAFAVRWAANQAARTGARLRIVCAYHWHLPAPGTPPSQLTEPSQLETPAREQAAAVVATAVADARGVQPGVDAHGVTVLGMATDALLTEAKTAALLVVGSHGRGALAAALLGSVGLAVATYATSPVVVVRGRAHTAIGPVVAAVGDTTSGDGVLETAFDEAYRRGCGLVVVRAGEAPAPRMFAAVAAPGGSAVAVQPTGNAVTRLQDRYPTVPVEVEPVTGNTADVLVAASRSAQLVVTDTRGRSLDPVTHHLLQRADCPVLVLRDEVRDDSPADGAAL